MRLKYSITFIIFGIFLLCYFSYPIFIYELYGRYVPGRWRSELMKGTVGDFRTELGVPQYEMAVKSTIQWRVNYWWGYKQLELLADETSNKKSFPDYVNYSVHVDGYGSFSNIYFKVIGGSKKSNVWSGYPLINKSNLKFLK